MPEGTEEEQAVRVLPAWYAPSEGRRGWRDGAWRGEHGGDKPFDRRWVGDESKSRGPGLAAPSPPAQGLLLSVLGVSCLGGLSQEAPPAPESPPDPRESQDKGRGSSALRVRQRKQTGTLMTTLDSRRDLQSGIP